MAQPSSAPSSNTSPTATPILALDDVSYTYTKGGPDVISHISHDFAAGQVTSIVGPSGAGKTTLLSLISGLTTPTGGAVLFEGCDLASIDRYRYRSRDIGVIFQSYNLLPGLTVLENIMLTMDASGKRFDRPKREIALDLLKQVHLPERYADERILHLSGGEQQRVAIARALSDDPRVIIADEPTGNLDPATQDDIMRIFLDLAHQQGRCVIIVTHSPQIAEMSDAVLRLAPAQR
ncbi:ABC transporter ATP-binding protein [Bifidobacterium pseudolongum]|uniref:ABC transporter ATP-binding protein n=1 Tax=Bifidobacterium pseudolongum TaxID=1694 RepID=A0AB37P0W7_9BIFI|nr:ABC transporter ATP-binding protein [Bifidobacterium pseudolongum]NBH69022.1 ABC transporter ATP-binding protein [Bifidobacterium pseudolongum]RKI89101.1 ABC transporter ATP-binding protein [Bifidobacterium pseudolongum]